MVSRLLFQRMGKGHSLSMQKPRDYTATVLFTKNYGQSRGFFSEETTAALGLNGSRIVQIRSAVGTY